MEDNLVLVSREGIVNPSVSVSEGEPFPLRSEWGLTMSHFSIKTDSNSANQPMQNSNRANFMTERRDESVPSIQDGTIQNEVSKKSTQPVWDRDARELRVGNVVVKQFKWPAENQEQVLDAFQDNGWPPRIENPLNHDPSICPKRRLHDTIKCLNRKQVNGLIKFRGDGTGRGVLIEFIP